MRRTATRSLLMLSALLSTGLGPPPEELGEPLRPEPEPMVGIKLAPRIDPEPRIAASPRPRNRHERRVAKARKKKRGW